MEQVQQAYYMKLIRKVDLNGHRLSPDQVLLPTLNTLYYYTVIDVHFT